MDENAFKLFSLMVTTFTALVSALGLAYIGMKTAEANRNAIEATKTAEATQRQTTQAVQQVRSTLSVTANETKAAAEQVVQTLAVTAGETKAATEKVVETLAATSGDSRRAAEAVVDTLARATDATAQKLDDLRVTAGNTQRMGEAIHTLVNSNMSAQLAISSAALRRISDLTQDPRDAEIARQAQDLFNEHVAKQSEVDRHPPPTATPDGRGTGVPAALAGDREAQKLTRRPPDARTTGTLEHQAQTVGPPQPETQGDRVEHAVEKNIALTEKAGESAEGARRTAMGIHRALAAINEGLQVVTDEQTRVKGELADTPIPDPTLTSGRMPPPP